MLHEVFGAAPDLGSIFTIVRDQVKLGFLGAADHGEPALLGLGHDHLPVHLRLIAVDHLLDWLETVVVLDLYWALVAAHEAIKRTGGPIDLRVLSDYAALIDFIMLALEPIEVELFGGLAQEDDPFILEVF